MTLSFVHIACEKTISLRYIMQKKTKKHKQISKVLKGRNMKKKERKQKINLT